MGDAWVGGQSGAFRSASRARERKGAVTQGKIAATRGTIERDKRRSLILRWDNQTYGCPRPEASDDLKEGGVGVIVWAGKGDNDNEALGRGIASTRLPTFWLFAEAPPCWVLCETDLVEISDSQQGALANAWYSYTRARTRGPVLQNLQPLANHK